MSADNGYLIRKHPDGGFAAIMYFMSEDGPVRQATKNDKKFETLDDAITAVMGEYSEYGLNFDQEVRDGL